MANDANTGTDSGSISRVKIWKWLAPSMRADSIIEPGNEPM